MFKPSTGQHKHPLYGVKSIKEVPKKITHTVFKKEAPQKILEMEEQGFFLKKKHRNYGVIELIFEKSPAA